MNLPAPLAPRANLRRNALLGTALALVLGGVAFGGFFQNTPAANAQPVTITQPVQIPSFADVVEQVSPAVVGIRVRGETEIRIPGFDALPPGVPEEFFRGLPETETRPTMSMGSGFFISADGYIVTNNHVVDGGENLTVVMNDGTEYPAHLIGSDELTDLALIKVDVDREFRYVEFAPGEARIGDWVIAVGTPFGFTGTVTAGIVSAHGRTIGNSAYDDFIQIDAAVNSGNSGGPAFNLAGQVIGVNTAIYSPSGGNVGIAFAVPASVAAAVIADLQEHGSVQRGWLGVQIQPVTEDIARALGLDGPGGAIVVRPLPDSPALAAGLKTQDVILAINGTPVADSRGLARAIGNLDPNAEVQLTVVRGGERTEVSVTLAAMPTDTDRIAAAPETTPAPSPNGLGLGLAETRNGAVVIADLDPSGTAAIAGLREGDRITAIGNTGIDDVADVRTAVEEARAAGRDAVLFQIERNGQTALFAVPL